PYTLFSPKSLPTYFRTFSFPSDSLDVSLLGVYTLPKFKTLAKLKACLATTACAARTFGKVNLLWFNLVTRTSFSNLSINH
ncbi:hypothetical protein, partial [Capnocytophaga sp. oral taxon 380]|uniref:hypothetical protein n=1 Tax=Capnocytophaga sp. oral taxon 380 TaxID=712217 RepID=UPI0002A2CBC1